MLLTVPYVKCLLLIIEKFFILGYIAANGVPMSTDEDFHEAEERDMLSSLGMKDMEELFEDIPKEIKEDISLKEGFPERMVMDEVRSRLEQNKSQQKITSFLGAGVYRHYVPAAVEEIMGKSEFYTSYTPYQPEISQGMLQALFEYQSLICELTGMKAANTSMYDYSTALAEAILMSARINKGSKFLLPENIHWDKPRVIQNYLRGNDIEIERVKFDKETGGVDVEDLKTKVDDDILGVYLESPNLFGVFEDRETVDVFSDIKEDEDAVFVAGIDPLALTLMEPPANWNADIVVGDSQSLGIPTSFGGPTVGIFACRPQHVRRMPGRIIGETEDADGRRAYCMTLQTREQHIRRERATSNICTNQSLMALSSAVYMLTKGGRGLEDLAKENYRNAHDLAERINELDDYRAPYFENDFFNEFVIKTGMESQKVIKQGLQNDVIPGVNLTSEGDFQGIENMILTAVTEMNDERQKDELVRQLKEAR